jgi:IS1 family transposase
MHSSFMMSWSLFPPQTRAVQLDERWSFVGKKEAQCDPRDLRQGDDWDHTAVDPESRLVLSVVPGKRTADNCVKVVEDVKRRTGGRTDILFTSDEHAPYQTAIEQAYAVAVPQPKRPGPGRPPNPRRVLPPDLGYATVCKTREKGRVVQVVRTIVFGTIALIELLLKRLNCGHTINTSYVERNNGTDRRQNVRKVRKTYCFSKDWDIHNAATYFIAYSYNFCWPVRTLRVQDPAGHWHDRSPAMAAGLADHVWPLREWLTLPAPPE